VRLSIIIPAHNEEQRLPPVLKLYDRYFGEKYGSDVEIIVVVNYSFDNTLTVTESFAATHPVVSVINEPRKVGKGGAVLMGLRRARGELIGFVDADGATSPEAFDDLVEHIGDAGCIIASRWLKESVVEPRQPLSRQVMSRCFNLFVRIMFGLKITDTQCGAKVFRKKAVEAILDRLGLTNWAFDVDMLFQTKRAGFSIREVPTVWNDKAGSKIRYVSSSLDMVMALVRLRLIYSPFKWVVDIYNSLVRMLRRMKGDARRGGNL
jgi:glycosyltransferase involved in cell wall biosynthesis